MKFKRGDKVKFIGNYDNHLANIGHSKLTLRDLIKRFNNILTVSNPEGNKGYIEVKEDEFWCFKEDELELIQNKQFTKSDLKDGDVVTYRDGRKRIVQGENLKKINGDYGYDLGAYREDLTEKYDDENFDIIKVERPAGYTTVFERKKEILDETEKRYLRDVIRPFRNKVISIRKMKNPCRNNKEYIAIELKKEESIVFPEFKEKSMYKGMHKNKAYSIEQLGL